MLKDVVAHFGEKASVKIGVSGRIRCFYLTWAWAQGYKFGGQGKID